MVGGGGIGKVVVNACAGRVLRIRGGPGKRIAKAGIWLQFSVTTATCPPQKIWAIDGRQMENLLRLGFEMSHSFDDWFGRVRPGTRPWEWQRDLSMDASLLSRCIRIPTGFGKTLGVLVAWCWNRLIRKDEAWPRRLVWCLPMRVLTEQTAEEARKFLAAAGLGHVPVHVLMGGADAGEWHLHPENESILVGTQDMLLSRALNRGYGAARARWPMDFGLLNHDCLWVMDEVQLMDVGLATSSQLQAFRHADSPKALRPYHTWWISATLQESWLQSVDTKDLFANLAPKVEIPSRHRTGGLWEVTKPREIHTIKDEKDIARLVSERHQQVCRLYSFYSDPQFAERVRSAVSVEFGYWASSGIRSISNAY